MKLFLHCFNPIQSLGRAVLALYLLACYSPVLLADNLLEFMENPKGTVTEPALTLGTNDIGSNTEFQTTPDEIFNLWIQDETFYKPHEEDRVEMQKVLEKEAETFKLENVVPAIRFKAGQADIPESFVTKLRAILDSMKHRANVRLHFVGHTDSDPLGGATKAKYGDNFGLSKARAGIAAEFFQRALDLPADVVSYDGVGDSKPIASNNTAAGKSRNRRVEVQVWYDQITEKVLEKQVVVQAPGLNRIKVCRKETVCKLRYKEGNARRAKLKNLVSPLRMEENQTDIPAEFMRQITEVLANLRSKKNVVIRFVGHTDNLPLEGRDARIYGNHDSFSKARARRVALAVKDALGLSNSAISSDGKGLSYPVATNDTMKGRALNRRIEVEFWHDDPFEQYTAEAQACPEAEAADTLARAYDAPTGPIRAIRFDKGQPIIPPGYAARLQRLMDDIEEKSNVRLAFIGYTDNTRMDRRTAMVYGDDIGLSTARARRAMEKVQQELGLDDKQVEFEGLGFVHSKDVISTGFVQFDGSRVEVEVRYDELAILEEDEGLQITRINREAEVRNPYSLNLMRITIDGEPMHDPYKNVPDIQRCTDVALDDANIQFKFENLKLKPRLSVAAWPNTIRYQDDKDTDILDNRVQFKAYNNYPDYIERAEVRIFEKEQSTRERPYMVVDLNRDGEGEWLAEFEDYQAPVKEMKYLLRIYSPQEQFDETRTLPLWIVDKVKAKKTEDHNIQNELLVAYGENQLALQNIPLKGGTVSVVGDNIPKEHSVWLAGYPVPVNDSGKFAGEFIFPKGLHTMEVAILDKEGNGDLYLRDLGLNRSDWFYVGVADITATKDSTNGPAALVTGDTVHYDNDLNIDGRLAYFVKGEFGDNWQLTSSADTREGPLSDIFNDFTYKIPDTLFRRIDPDYYYPTFGDDSSVEEHAPTSGKFYFKLKKDNNHAIWGNFKINYTDTDLAQIDRGLYGANLHFETEATTRFGEKTFAFDSFAAEPGTLGGRDEFRGTGGSLYFLRHQDIMLGSDRARIEVRDKDSGIVIATKDLLTAIDYDIDYIQGRILLSEPLLSTANDNLLVDSGSISGHPVYLVMRYEFTPGFDELDNLAMGGRAHYWIADSVKLGISSSKQDEDDNKSSLNGMDITWRKSAGTWVKLESSTSEGTGSDVLLSSDGGFSFDPLQLTGNDIKASAQRIEASVQLRDVIHDATGTAIFYMQQKEAGFSAPGQLTEHDTDQWGGTLTMPITSSISLNVKADIKDQDQSLTTESLEVNADYQLNENWKLSAGNRLDSREDNSLAVPDTQEQGVRSDVALQAHYDSRSNWTGYGFTQMTANATGNREENSRMGIGGTFRATDKLQLEGELSSGDLGEAVRLGTDYLISNRSNLYLNYALENERSDNGVRSRQGNMATGLRSRFSDSTSVFAEERYTHGDVPTGLTHAMGIDMAPNDRWNIGATVEMGTLEDQTTAATTERQAIGFSLGYGIKKMKYAGALEYRDDISQNSSDSSESERKKRR
ncbi:MAG: OmpA family protein [Gammaproteobacteria bacterium]